MTPTSVNQQKASKLILLDKAAGTTSFEALGPLKREFGTGVGHAGTLDRFATGLLVALTGKLTKLVPLLTNLDKIYEAVFEFGRQTDTLDPEGRLVSEGPIPAVDEIKVAIQTFVGTINQVPPEFSAVHVNGRRAYERVLAGETINLSPRPVTIHSFDLINWNPPLAKVRIHCSKGTYVRSLARDLAHSIKTVGMVVELRRIRIGQFFIPSGGREDWTAKQLFASLNLPMRVIDDPLPARRGVPPDAWGSWGPEKSVALFDTLDELVAVLKNTDEGWRYQFVCPD